MDTTMDVQAGRPSPQAADAGRAWSRIGQGSGYVAGVGFLVVTVLYLLDVRDILDGTPDYVRTAAGPLHDEATFWAAIFAHQHRILWDVIVRDLVGPVAFIALIVLALALRGREESRGPEGQLMVAFLLVGSTISAVASLLFLGNVEFWRITGWSGSDGQVSMIAVGRATTAINNLTTWPEAFGYLVLGAGLLCLGRALRRAGGWPTRLTTLAYLTAASLVAFALTEMARLNTAQSIASLIVGAILAPWLCIWIGFRLGHETPPSIR